MLNPDQLLTPEESAQVDAALMTNKEKFGTRVAIYALRVLKQIAAAQGMPMGAIGPAELSEFVEHQEGLVTANGLAVDEPFKDFGRIWCSRRAGSWSKWPRCMTRP
ncbi:MAG: hypothetical protein HC771_05460 [Synechococcales cyanobacterium CRU_2_2]|nr:hypothetical protein [Synechococcales cyanobacterium CRU_2_2]